MIDHKQTVSQSAATEYQEQYLDRHMSASLPSNMWNYK